MLRKGIRCPGQRFLTQGSWTARAFNPGRACLFAIDKRWYLASF
jgi:hypothetical protein